MITLLLWCFLNEFLFHFDPNIMTGNTKILMHVIFIASDLNLITTLMNRKWGSMSDRLKIGQEVLIHGYVDEIRKDTVIIRNEGGYFGTVEYEVTDIEMSDTNDVLDKIMNEITMLLQFNRLNVIRIIDKYRTIYSRKIG